MSISRLTASLASATSDITVAAAALNFDFSLVKIEAPEEFRLVGGTLSAKRRVDAEDGKTHVTARKLGALFDKVIPPIPNLIKAYGSRASEISASPIANPKPSSRDGVFATQVGADGTTVWAAATSGRGAIAVHLLACLLARIWTGPEAASLWTEIVDQRRQEITTAFENNEEIDFATLSVARQEFSRRQLAEWDASARGWLRAADIAKDPELKKLMLIVKNIDACVDHGSNVYEGVMRVWKKALTAMECLLKGMPQSVSDGSVPIAIWAWHLYPDLIVLRATNTDVRFKDSLVPHGGCLTIGLKIEDPKKKKDGVYWSLSLANLRYYGDPVISQRAAVPDSSRLTFEQLALVAFGSVIGQWNGYGQDIIAAGEFFIALWDCINHAALHGPEFEKDIAQGFLTCDSNWVGILVNAARTLTEAEGVEQQTAEMLVKLGQRRGKRFLQTDASSFFGLTDNKILLGALESEEAWISLLRGITTTLGMKKSEIPIPVIIRYTQPAERGFEYASTLSDGRPSRKRKHGGLPPSSQRLKRWVSSKSVESLADYPRNTIESNKVGNWVTRREQIGSRGEEVLDREEAGIYSEDSSNIIRRGPPDIKYSYFIGHQTRAALFVPSSDLKYCQTKYSDLVEDAINLHVVTKLLRSNAIRADRLIELLAYNGHYNQRLPLGKLKGLSSLIAFSSAARVYKLLSKATISPNILSRPFNRAHWFQEGMNLSYDTILDAFHCAPLTRAESFACIALLESGVHDIRPAALEQVMALSSSDSIYATAPLLCDPWETPQDDEIRRIAGNIGRAGLAMLLAPENVRIRPRDNTRWTMVNHADFDGKPEDNFQGTSLHLSFTGYERPLDTGVIGSQDVDVFLLETRVSLHDEGTWLADLNVLQSLQSPAISKLSYPVQCNHPAGAAPGWSTTALDNWDEFFDRPENPCIVRAYRNWIARLAFVCVSHQLGRRTIIMPESICWECYANLSVCLPTSFMVYN